MSAVWRVWVACMAWSAAVAGNGQERDGEVWVWARGATANRKASSIPGYVAPTSTPATTTSSPPITTFRPTLEGLGRGAPGPRHYTRITANPFFLGAFSPFSLVPAGAPHVAHDGTTKSRTPIDTTFDSGGGAVLDAGDKYTTLDRLQQERGAPPPLPRPQQHQLGGLHPDEVFYADDDLLIIKGGGFNSDAFEEPSQRLDADDYEGEESEDVAALVAPLPSPQTEYNGNIPAIVPPPTRTSSRPFSLFVEASSTNDYIVVPHMAPRPIAPQGSATYLYSAPPTTSAMLILPVQTQNGYYLPPKHSLQLPHSLAGDTDVNFLKPRPLTDPDAEVFLPRWPQETRPPSKPRL